jgi:MFS family permease
MSRNFTLFFSARITSQLGDQLYTFAVLWYILDVTGSSLQMTIPLLLTTIITACVSLFGGAFADRVSRKKILVRTDIVQGTVLVLMAVLVACNSLQVWMIYLLTAILAFCGAVFSPAASALIPDIVLPGQIPQAMSANQLTVNLCTIAGMLSGGVLYQFFGITSVLLFNAASNFASAIMESALKVSDHSKQKEKTAVMAGIRRSAHDLADGYRHVSGNKPVFRYLWVSSVFNIISLPVGMVLIPYFFNVFLNASAVAFAIPQAFTWVGMVAATLIVPLAMRRSTLPRLIGRSLFIMSVMTLAGTPIVVGAVSGWLDAGAVSVIWTGVNLLVGLSVNLFIIPLYTFFQQQSAGEFRGRFWGIENSMRTLALGCGYLLAGALAQSVSLPILFAVYAVLTAVLAVFAKRLADPEKNNSPASPQLQDTGE